MIFKPHKVKKDQNNILLMAVAGIGLYLFFKKKSATAPIVPPTTGGGSEMQPIAPSPVYVAPVQPIYAPSEPVYIEPTQPIAPSPISTLPVFTNPILEIINLFPVEQYPSKPIYVPPVYTSPERIYKPEPVYEAPVQPAPAPVYYEPTPPPMEYFPIYEPTPIYQPAPTPIYYEPTPVYYEPAPIYQLEPIIVGNPPQISPVDEPLPPTAYIEEYKSINDPNYFYMTENIGAGSGGLFDFLSNQVWLQNLTTFQAESYLAVDTITKDQSDQA
jgi:hypothetical protein